MSRPVSSRSIPSRRSSLDLRLRQTATCGFYQPFRREKMPLSNVKPSREYVRVRVKFGGALMPAFRQRLSEAEIDTLIDYMESK